ncbi:MAG TPA: RES family NAD+ phosphorylase [Tepidisphaeraceae bacterium]|nr:RES family NAD+ phosphorylase [Tepidisphaeraceae bacterium]
MKITAWRIVKAKFSARAFEGEEARRFGGRWNSRGTAMIYTAGSQALAVLEILVHLEASELLRHYRLIPVTFDQRLVNVLDRRVLPANWGRRPPPASVRAIGDDWVASAKSVVLRVPSVIVPDENNYLINASHPQFRKLVIGSPRPFRFDPRLLRPP